MKRKIYRGSFDYGHQPGIRRKLAHYLKAGGFRQIAGTFIPGRSVQRNRFILLILAAILTAIGLYNVFF